MPDLITFSLYKKQKQMSMQQSINEHTIQHDFDVRMHI